MLSFIREQASSFAGDVDFVIVLIFVLTGFWLLVAEGVLFWLLFKFRKSASPKSQYISGEKKEEKKWIAWPHNLILICDVFIIVFAVKVWYHIKQELPPAEETIRVIGQQWTWRFVHPGLDKQLGTEDDVETVDELHLKKDVVYHFKLESIDVLHSFSIPVFRLKQDAVPGRVITGWFKPIREGTYDLQCAEMCGIGHGIMKSKLVVESSEAHEEWLKKADPIATRTAFRG